MSVGCERDGISYRLVDKILQIRSPMMMKGYDGKNDNFTQDGYYITNDQFEIDQDGFYYFIGRSDDMFKSGGNKIFPSEIERVIEQHLSVDKCVTIPISDPVKDFKPYDSEEMDKKWKLYKEIKSEYQHQKTKIFFVRKEKYYKYLESWEWERKSHKVKKRANFICEGCLTSPATEVHHITYSNIYNVFMFELLALCSDCHRRIHENNST
jgi:acyl-coenzyme A synthetase/AMP-(fatty) acid ligase